MSEHDIENNSSDKDKKKYNYYFPLFTGLGIAFGAALNQTAIGLCLGISIGLILDAKKNK